MRRSARYNTKNEKAILSYLASVKDSFVTANQVSEYMESQHISMSHTTVYRQLGKLVSDGVVRKNTFIGSGVLCFQYVGPDKYKQGLPCLKCEKCGEVQGLDCDELALVTKHILEIHAFQVDDSKTVFYGTCRMCL